MGMESYFVQVLPLGVSPVKVNDCNSFQGHCSMTLVNLIQQLSMTIKVQAMGKAEYIVEEAIKLTIGVEDEYVRDITLEGCFSWYKEGLKLCYAIIRNISAIMDDITVYHPGELYFKVSTEEEFLAKITELYQAKHAAFNAQFNAIELKVPPGKSFYDAYARARNKGFWEKLFKPS